jgi:hypothetical protein|tara:strand:- start:251 stop:391 length:141 start_codon:yes stop_codon:yes gene_type:complete
MLSIKLCKIVLNKNNKKYSNEQVKLIRDQLYKMVLIIDEAKDKDND